MNTNLWTSNHPKNFWRCLPPISDEEWMAAIQKAAPILGSDAPAEDINALLEWTLGEGQFGSERWQLGGPVSFYYRVKPLIPRALTRLMRKIYSGKKRQQFRLGWPIEDRYIRFQWAIMTYLLELRGQNELEMISFWPAGQQAALVLTHDIETARGQDFIRQVADLEANYGFRSSFNFVPERYVCDTTLMAELREDGFEIGVHGLSHDGRLFSSYETFIQRAKKINGYLKEFKTGGFRAPLTHRNAEWMQALEIDYDLSFFDTDPYEPIAGGTMSIWPFMVGHFVELPYTLPQDYTINNILEEKTPRVWLEKAEFIESYQGMILVNTHPDYLLDKDNWNAYVSFLEAMQRKNHWAALPKETAAWWRNRMQTPSVQALPRAVSARISFTNDHTLKIEQA